MPLHMEHGVIAQDAEVAHVSSVIASTVRATLLLPDANVAGMHTSISTGLKTLHINRPYGSKNIKIRYPKGD
ncbi:hypothetical protein D8B23_04105 [Verminephrobacter aporrectodeae subsp. tuberculatae]|nr:hypothetical protein [Verminephrobacter aporrectodeae subsp. tuberculatae]